ncbi:MAG: acyl-CoA dehydrogenase [Sphingomonadaceae bacterium]|nr:acyl-CoA dehydrogenase [Sphingomonadaceae bacterium]
MDITLSPDHITLLDALDSLVNPYTAPPTGEVPFALEDTALEGALVESGFLEVAREPEFGLVGAALVTERIARLPYAVEAAASAFVGPLLDEELSRPVCVSARSGLWQPIAYLRGGSTLILLEDDDSVSILKVSEDMVQAEPESLFAYPMGKLIDPSGGAATRVGALSADQVRIRVQLALAAEVSGLLRAALDSTVTYVSERKQFGRPLATFQALRHRLSEIHVRTESLYWMMLRAAGLQDPGQAALTALYAQESARVATYDFHQLLGAMGMTLEHPLHFWTYRLKALIGQMGGRGEQARRAAASLWP